MNICKYLANFFGIIFVISAFLLLFSIVATQESRAMIEAGNAQAYKSNMDMATISSYISITGLAVSGALGMLFDKLSRRKEE